MGLPTQETEVKIFHYHSAKSWYSSLARQIVLVYLILWAVGVFLLSNSFLGLVGLNEGTILFLQPFKRWIFLLLTAPLLYFIVVKLLNTMQYENAMLDASHKKMLRLSRVYRMLSEVNHAILRAHDRKQLLREICSIIQEKMKLSFVWIGLSETERALPQMIVTSGQRAHYLEDLFDGLQMGSIEEKSEPALASFRKRQCVIVNDTKRYAEKRLTWQKRAIENNYAAIAAFPLKTTSGLLGVVAIYASESNVFSQEEIDLLREMTADISYGLSDIEQKEQLYYAANYDVITNLPNRQLLEDRLNQTMARAYHEKKMVGLMCVDLVNFDECVATYGQAAGDKMLQETARHLNYLVRDGDTVARLERKQFGIMLSNIIDEYSISTIAQKIITPFLVQLTNYKTIPVKMYAGISVFPKDAENSLMLIKNAEMTLRGIINNPKMNCAYFSKEVASGEKYSKIIESELGSGLKNKEFELEYRPIIHLGSRETIGKEALLRWRHPRLGHLSLAQFIDMIEDKNILMNLNEWMVHSIGHDVEQWKKTASEGGISINLISKLLFQQDFPKQMDSILQELTLDLKQYPIAIEIPESVFTEESDDIIAIVNALKERGIKMYVDDFGMGGVSLGYLSELPIEAVKIDPLLIRNLEKEKSSINTIKGIIAFAQGFGIQIIAEGVETERQLNILESLGCLYVQGHIVRLLQAPL